MATVSARRLPARSLLSIMVAFALMACSGDSTNDATDVSIDRGGGGGTDATAPDVGTEDGAATDTAGDTAPTPDTSTDAGVDAVADTGSDAASDASGACGVLPDYGAPAQSGVAYVGHFASPELRWYRTDGDTPTHGGSIDLASFAHDMVLDPVADLLAVAHDVTSEVVLYGLDRPTDPASDIAAPSRITAFGLGEDTPRVLASDPARERLFVGATPPVDGGLLEDMRLYTYDVSDPGAPTPIGDALVIPVVTTIAVDANYGLLFLVDFTTQDLVMYDVSGDGPVALPGDPINLRALYPQESSTGFQVRNLQVDADNGRVLAARAEGPNSEVIAFSYPSAGASAAACPPAPGYADLTMIADGFDIDIPPTDRDNLLGGDRHRARRQPAAGRRLWRLRGHRVFVPLVLRRHALDPRTDRRRRVRGRDPRRSRRHFRRLGIGGRPGPDALLPLRRLARHVTVERCRR